MAGFIEVATVAFVAQLLVLPGEKVQFIIAALATRYSPLVVVAAAGAAFAGWTTIEIALGAALKGALPVLLLDLITATLFLSFAILLLRSTPETDRRQTTEASNAGGTYLGLHDEPEVTIRGHQVPTVFGGFLPIFVLMAIGEFGDKTQLVTIGLAIEYGARPAIWVGEMAAIIPVSLANALVFDRFSRQYDARKAHFIGATIFAFFGLDTVLHIATRNLLEGPGISVWEWLVSSISRAIPQIPAV
jgi:putative Ca2+/H+ antiporter (TMEM165/GDT1 family)